MSLNQNKRDWTILPVFLSRLLRLNPPIWKQNSSSGVTVHTRFGSWLQFCPGPVDDLGYVASQPDLVLDVTKCGELDHTPTNTDVEILNAGYYPQTPMQDVSLLFGELLH